MLSLNINILNLKYVIEVDTSRRKQYFKLFVELAYMGSRYAEKLKI
ncbi:MAG: hypothetical protein QXV06_07975 [Ignisphaera sp.]